MRTDRAMTFDAEPEDWITVNGAHVPLDESGQPAGEVGEKMQGEAAWGPSQSFSQDLEEHNGDHVKAARAFYKRELQGKSFEGDLGEEKPRKVQIVAGNLGKIENFMRDNPVKAELVPHIPEIIESGEFLGRRETPDHKKYQAFRTKFKEVELNGKRVKTMLDVGELNNGLFAYSLNHEGSPTWEAKNRHLVAIKKTKAQDAKMPEFTPPLKRGANPPWSRSASGISGDSIAEGGGEINLFVLEVVDMKTGERLPEYEDKAEAPATDTLTFDAKSLRRKDENGFLHVAVSHISKETVNPYRGREIPGWSGLGLDPDRIYQGYRSGAALAAGAETFNGLPLLMDHHPDSAENPQKEHRIGSLGTDAAFNAPYLDNSLILTDARAIELVESGLTRELSASYRYEPDFTPGEFEGQPYDFVMTNIRGNHVALVEEGRAGRDVLVADHQAVGLDHGRRDFRPAPGSPAATGRPVEKNMGSGANGPRLKPTTNDSQKGLIMNLLEKLKEFFAGLIKEGAKAEEIKEALAEALPAAGETQDEEPAAGPAAESKPAEDDEGDGEEVVARLAAAFKGIELDDLYAFQRGMDDLANQQKFKEIAGRIQAALTGAPAAPSADEAEEKKDEAAPAAAADAKPRPMSYDAASIRRQARAEAVAEVTALMRAKSQAADLVRPLVGALDIMAFDSAADIHRHALKSRGLSVTTRDLAALRDMVALELKHLQAEASPAPGLSFDAAPAKYEGPFAHLANIRVAH